MGHSRTRGMSSMVGTSLLVLFLGLVRAAPVTETANVLSLSETGESRTIGYSTAMILQDMGVEEDDAFDCDWYSAPPGSEPDLPRAAVSLEVCQLYLKQDRLVDCVKWTREYDKKHPKVIRHISLQEVHSKCMHVKSALDQKVNVPGDTATCVWCMTNTNTN